MNRVPAERRTGGFQPPTRGAAVGNRTRSLRSRSAAGSRRYGVLAVLLTAAAACGQDVVTVRTDDGGRREVAGRVVAYDSGGLTLTAPTGATLDFDAADVVRVVTPRLPVHLAGLRAWADRDVPAARERLAAALAEEPREWVRREILAALVTADLAAADRPAAGSHALALLRSDPGATDRLGRLPVPWGDRRPRAAELAAANRWLNGPDDAETLLGAGVLVGEPDRRADAVGVLKRLSRSAGGPVAGLARLQRWRAKVLDGALKAGELETARRRVDALPEALRAGPRFTLGVAYEAAGRNEEAVAAFLFAPLADPADPARAADGLVRAAKLLRPGDPTAAIRLLREARERFPSTEASGEAAAALRELTAVPANPPTP